MAGPVPGASEVGGGRIILAAPADDGPEFPGEDLLRVFGDIACERINQMRKWGVQRHTSIDPTTLHQMERIREYRRNYPPAFIDAAANGQHSLPSARHARSLCEAAGRDNRLSWVHILVEELCEAVEAVALYGDDSPEARMEIVQTAAVAVAWLESFDARRETP